MKALLKHFALFIALVVIVTLGIRVLSKSEEGKINIAISDDISGIAIEHMIESTDVEDSYINTGYQAHTVVDCCSNTTQWALSSGTLDMAIICPEAAKVLTAEDDSFKVVGAVVENSDILVTQVDKPRNVGVTQNRNYQIDLARDRFGEDIEIVPMIATALPHAYQKEMVDAVVIDIVRGIKMTGEKLPGRAEGNQVTYVLVVSKEFFASKEYGHIIEGLNNSIEILQESSIEHVEKFRNISFEEEEKAKWKEMNIKFQKINL